MWTFLLGLSHFLELVLAASGACLRVSTKPAAETWLLETSWREVLLEESSGRRWHRDACSSFAWWECRAVREQQEFPLCWKPGGENHGAELGRG